MVVVVVVVPATRAFVDFKESGVRLSYRREMEFDISMSPSHTFLRLRECKSQIRSTSRSNEVESGRGRSSDEAVETRLGAHATTYEVHTIPISTQKLKIELSAGPFSCLLYPK